MNVAFIPLRGGSKSIPLKNIKKMAGKPLAYWTLKAAMECSEIHSIYVSTDSEQIKAEILKFGFEKVNVIDRSEKTATDNASTESAMLEFAETYEFDNICLIQATSPLLTANDLIRGFEKFETSDSVLSVVRQKRFIWKTTGDCVCPSNYNYNIRPRRQDFEGFLVENGAFYITSRKSLLESKCRISGRITAVEMPEETYFEIDEPTDWLIVENLLKARFKNNRKTKPIKMFLSDCDGTLTDGGMYYTATGDTMKKFNTVDGLGFSLLQQRGVLTGIISGENSEILRRRAEKIGVNEVAVGIKNKLEFVYKLCKKYDITLEEIAYIGDDFNDRELLEAVGLSICPVNAINQIKEVAMFVTKKSGGNGAVREAVEYILNFKGYDACD